MNKTLHYLFDPLCGWCYGATPAVSELLATPGVVVNLLPTGLFSGEGARAMDDAFANFAWSNDQRIERLTGQRFTERYRHRVLGDRQQLFDSGPATVALTAVSLTDPARELDSPQGHPACTLRGWQRRDVVGNAGQSSEGARSRTGRCEGCATRCRPARRQRARIDQAKALMREFSARGVPTLIAEAGAKRWILDPAAAYSNPRALISQLETA